MNNRIGLLLKVKDVTASKFAEMIGVQPSNISHILSGRNKPSLDFITKVIETFPDINLEWLMFGKGSMLQHEIISPDNAQLEQNDDHVYVSEQQENPIIPDLFSQDYLVENSMDENISAQNTDIELSTDNVIEQTSENILPEQPIAELAENSEPVFHEKTTEASHQELMEDFKKNEQHIQKSHISANIPDKIVLIYPDNTFEIALPRPQKD
jgi:transcriptional regulator with XRE-family HTH domain